MSCLETLRKTEGGRRAAPPAPRASSRSNMASSTCGRPANQEARASAYSCSTRRSSSVSTGPRSATQVGPSTAGASHAAAAEAPARAPRRWGSASAGEEDVDAHARLARRRRAAAAAWQGCSNVCGIAVGAVATTTDVLKVGTKNL